MYHCAQLLYCLPLISLQYAGARRRLYDMHKELRDLHININNCLCIRSSMHAGLYKNILLDLSKIYIQPAV